MENLSNAAAGTEQDAQFRSYITENFDRALEEGLIKVFFQPVVRGTNGRVCNEEALARWMEPGREMLYPDSFVPVLEDEGLAYRLDLYVLRHVLDGIRDRVSAGLVIVPVSINLSRTDFEKADMVEEIRSRVDEAGVDRSRIIIEITESVIGRDFEYMKSQIDRFRALGFKVWMDDFGSGYSSLDFLQKIDIDALKLDVNFMREYDTNPKTRIILTQLVRMVSKLGIETITEGVDSAEQVEFLNEIGCTKMQGFYFCEPIPVETIFERYVEGRQIGFEDPGESAYYETIGGISLFDLDGENIEENDSLQKYFETLPVAILEYDGEKLTVARCTRSYKQFLEDAFEIDDHSRSFDHAAALRRTKAGIFNLIDQSRAIDHRLMFEERLNDRMSITGFIKHSADNPVTGASAYTVAILSNRNYNDSTAVTFARAARALSSDYISLYYVDIMTGDFIQYEPDAEHENLSAEIAGKDFFNASERSADAFVHKDDLGRFLSEFRRDNVLEAIDSGGSFTLSYRRLTDGDPIYVNLKAVRTDSDHIMIGISNVDAYMRHREALERAQEESITYARISALSGEFLVIYTVDPETEEYSEYGASKANDELGMPRKGRRFFEEMEKHAASIVHPDDLERFMAIFTKENVLKDIRDMGLFELNYRIMAGGEPVYVSFKAAIVREKDGPRLVAGVSNIDERVKRNQEYEASLTEARNLASIDILTGVKNKHAYVDVESELNELIDNGQPAEFAIVVLDLNGLKNINDSHGHQTGDNYIKAGCSIICDIFGRSLVYRVGGDEFAVIARGREYERIDELMREMHEHNEMCIQKAASGADIGHEMTDMNAMEAAAKRMTIAAAGHSRDEAGRLEYSDASAGSIYSFDPDDVVIACGMARYEGDRSVAAVFDRADLAMYENKNEIKKKTRRISG